MKSRGRLQHGSLRAPSVFGVGHAILSALIGIAAAFCASPIGAQEVISIPSADNQRRIDDSAAIAQCVYSGCDVPGWTLVEAGRNPSTGLNYGIFRNDSSGDYQIGFAGTEDSTDWGANALNAIVGTSPQQVDALAIAHRAFETYGGPSGFSCTGHSMGGGNCQAVAMVFGIPGTVFNSAPISAAFAITGGNGGGILNVRTQGDPVSVLGTNGCNPITGCSTQFGTSIVLPFDTGCIGPMSCHGMENVLAARAGRRLPEAPVNAFTQDEKDRLDRAANAAANGGWVQIQSCILGSCTWARIGTGSGFQNIRNDNAPVVSLSRLTKKCIIIQGPGACLTKQTETGSEWLFWNSSYSWTEERSSYRDVFGNGQTYEIANPPVPHRLADPIQELYSRFLQSVAGDPSVGGIGDAIEDGLRGGLSPLNIAQAMGAAGYSQSPTLNSENADRIQREYERFRSGQLGEYSAAALDAAYLAGQTAAGRCVQ